MPTCSRRRLLQSSVTAAVAGLAGCGGERPTGDTATVNPALEETPPETETGPYGATATERLGRPRQVVVANRLVRPARASVSVTDSGEPVFDQTVRVPPAGGGTVGRAVVAPGRYDVRVTTPSGRETTTTWEVTPTTGDLGVDIDDGLTVRDRYTGQLARRLVTADDGVSTDRNGTEGETATASETVGTVKANTEDSLVADSVGRGGLVVDNPGDQVVGRLALTDGETALGSLRLRLPANARVVLPIDPQQRAPTARFAAAGEVDQHRWQPLVDRRLEVTLAPEPSFLCDLLWRDLWVRNVSRQNRDVRVRIVGQERQVLDRTVRVPAGQRIRRPAVVPPATRYRSTVVTGDLRERYEWPGCPPAGPVFVDVTDEEITVTVSPRPTR